MDGITYAQIIMTVISAVTTCLITRIWKRLDSREKLREKREKEERVFREAVREGLQAMLRDNIIRLSSDCVKQGHTQVFIVENMTHMFSSYTNLGGNGAVKYIYEQFMALPVIQEDAKKDGDDA